MKISQSAFDLIVAEEVSSKAYYIRHYQHPEWPGGASGITIGIGYDLGYASPAKIRADWASLVTVDMLLVMVRCSGVHGDAARQLLPEVRAAILIPWGAALTVFSTRDIPQWTATVIRACPGAELMTPTCLGVIVSIAYNRGAGGFTSLSDRNSEMHAIRADIAAKRYDLIPTRIASMKRLWPGVRGLRDRRDREAALFKTGLTTLGGEATVAATPVAPDPEVPVTQGSARTKPPATTNAQNTTAGAIVVGSAAIVQQGGFSAGVSVAIVAAAIVVAGIVWGVWYHSRNPK
ncbi:hypothetical protein [Bradyrhizobium sp. 150]|uniref:hypothetical protein n=1 Tax=Bradyrhizobium sp. 150 TaxID=2782625 RepID=UPI001FF9F68E|nr:hypothetical protein [Bradyrhizobium sp. 150]MCK1670319.1 hypothetical protein [Bradyrhizobium sp. 150]